MSDEKCKTKSKIVVLGSCMIDFSFYAPRLPKPGETLHGTKFALGYGGKGANQCVAASRLGASTALIAMLGDDMFGRDYFGVLKGCNVNTDHVGIKSGMSSGMAEITIAENGENSIVIVAGANTYLSETDVEQAVSLIQAADVLVFQFETPLDTTVRALKMQSEHTISIVNAAPAVVLPDSQILQLCSIFCVNETEAGAMTNMTVDSVAEAEKAVLKLLDQGCNTVIITLGKEGAVYATKNNRTVTHVPSVPVTPVDSTGAGDMFIGALAYYLAYFPTLGLCESIRRSCQIAAVSVQGLGTQSSFPSRKQLSDELFLER